MDPQSTNQGSFEVPRPPKNTNMLPQTPKAEALPSVPETQPQPMAPAMPHAEPTQPTQSTPLQPPVFQQTAVPAPTTTIVTPPDVAEDIDLIEKEWVDKAKAIVAHTHNDPYNQNKEMNKFKADYMKKRYGKDIRLDDK